MPDHDDLDLLLRSAVSTYGDPDSGLAQRVLARVSAEVAPAPRRRWLPWAIALPAAACLLLLLVLVGHKPAHTPTSSRAPNLPIPGTAARHRPCRTRPASEVQGPSA